MRASTDGGETWGEPLLLAENPMPEPGGRVFTRQVSYPSVTELEDGTLVVVWTRIQIGPEIQRGVIYCARVQPEASDETE